MSISGWKIETSVVLFFIILFIIFLLLYFLIRSLVRAWQLPEQIRTWKVNKKQYLSEKNIIDGLGKKNEYELHFNSISGGDNITVTLENNTISISGAGGGGCASGYSNIKVGSTTYPADDCESIVEFEATGCLGISSEAITNGAKVSFGITEGEILSCLGYEEKEIDICEGGSAVTYTFLVKSSG